MSLALASCQTTENFDQAFFPRKMASETIRKKELNRTVEWNRQMEEIEASIKHLQILFRW